MHFHEVGALDAIIDIVGTAAALEVLGVDEVHASPVANGMGMTRSAHGMIPIPAPAVVELLQGAPTYGVDVSVELTTPTGAALLAANAVGWGPMPADGGARRRLRRRTAASSTGRPNVVQVVTGDADRAGGCPGQPVMQLEANVDDATGETIAHAVAALLEAGAHDAWVAPIVMKKGRPAYTVVRAVRPIAWPRRSRPCSPARPARSACAARPASAGPRRDRGRGRGRGYPVRVKVSAGRVKVEHDDAARVARAHRACRCARSSRSRRRRPAAATASFALPSSDQPDDDDPA